MSYSKDWTSPTPGLLVFLVDQSGSMSEDFSAGQTKADFTALAVNRAIQNIVVDNADGTGARNRCKIVIIGYSSDAHILLAAGLDEIANNPIRIEKVDKLISDGAGGFVKNPTNFPIWIESEYRDTTNMEAAIDLATEVVKKWRKIWNDSPAPIVINISDGMPNSMVDSTNAAHNLMSENFPDGDVLLFNVHIAREGQSQQKIVTPSDSSLLPDNAKFLFNISSIIPPSLLAAANGQALAYQSNARGFVYNADANDLVRFLLFGVTKVTNGRETYTV